MHKDELVVECKDYPKHSHKDIGLGQTRSLHSISAMDIWERPTTIKVQATL